MINLVKKSGVYVYQGELSGKELTFVCEVCRKTLSATPEKSVELGWETAPGRYPLKTLTPRTCPDCSIKDTAWWAVAVEGKEWDALSWQHKKTIARISQEPEVLICK